MKGRNLLEQFPPDIAKGIEIHRAIDAFTDQHPIVGLSKKRLRASYRHYAPVIVDVFYDHFLAILWPRFHATPLDTFAAETYRVISGYHSTLPAPVTYMLPYMIEGNWLLNYATLEGIQRTLSGMAARTRFQSRMDESVADLRTHYPAFQQEFEDFFPLLEAHIKPMLP